MSKCGGSKIGKKTRGVVRKWNSRVKVSDVKLFSLTARSVCGLLKYSKGEGWRS